MVNLDDIKKEIAKRNGLGKLVTGHRVALFDEVALEFLVKNLILIKEQKITVEQLIEFYANKRKM